MSNYSSKNETSSASWMITFADLLSLLLTFFVLLFSLSNVRQDSWQTVINTMAEQFNPKRVVLKVSPNDTQQTLQDVGVAGLNLNYLQESMAQLLAQFPGFEGTEILRTKDQIIISVPSDVFFNRKDIQVAPDADKLLRALAGKLVLVRNKIKVAGHTDSVPISSGKFRSNWELSMARSRIVAGYFVEYGYRKPITVVGFADTQKKFNYRKDLENLERVDIIILTDQRNKGPYDLF